MQYRAWLWYYESHSQDKQCITILLDNIVLINTNYNLYIVSQLLKTIVHTNNGQWLGDKVHTHITWLAVNHEKLLYLLIVLMWHHALVTLFYCNKWYVGILTWLILISKFPETLNCDDDYHYFFKFFYTLWYFAPFV